MHPSFDFGTRGEVARMVYRGRASPSQNGFVPNGFIAENTLLLQMLQNVIESEGGDGIFLFADMEKAFDLSSWDYLHDAARALGFDENFIGLMNLAYNHDNPPQRQILINGHAGPWFGLHSGVAQGCPASPLFFLMITEALSRLINNDASIDGIQVGPHKFKISQYADDATFMGSVRDFAADESRGHLMHLRTWLAATCQRENAKKREGMLIGALNRDRARAPRGIVSGEKWLKNGDVIVGLGIPFSNSKQGIDKWLLGKYKKVKTMIVGWNPLAGASLSARNNLVQTKLYGSLRYYLFSLVFPDELITAIESDARHFLWAAHPRLKTSEIGTNANTRPWIHSNAHHVALKMGGAGLMNWRDHVTAFHAHWMRRYIDPRAAPWKLILDHWIQPIMQEHKIGRAVIVSRTVTFPMLFRGIPPQARLIMKSIRAFRALGLTYKSQLATSNFAYSEPLFSNPHFTIPDAASMRPQWHNSLQTIRLHDLTDGDGAPHSTADWSQWFYSMAPNSIANTPRVHEWADNRRVEYGTIQSALPRSKMLAIQRPWQQPEEGEYWAIVEKVQMGSQKVTYVQIALADGELELHEVILDISGVPHRTGTVYDELEDDEQLVPAATWIVAKKAGAAEALGEDELESEDDEPTLDLRIQGTVLDVYPNSTAMCFPSDDAERGELPRMSIRAINKELTAARLADQPNTSPSCIAGWAERVNNCRPVAWTKIFKSIRTVFTNDDDEKTWLKLLHRNLYVRRGDSSLTEQQQVCRVCEGFRERMTHLWQCPKIKPFWKELFAFTRASGTPAPQSMEIAIIFGLWEHNGPIEDQKLGPTYCLALLRLGWRKMYAAFCKVSLEQKKFRWQSVLLQTLKALRDAGLAIAVQHRIKAARSPDNEPYHIHESRLAELTPVEEIDSNGVHCATTTRSPLPSPPLSPF